METIAKDNLKEIFAFLNNSLYFLILKQVNKEWKKIIENEMKIEKNENKNEFYFLVNDFISRKDFEKLNIQFTFLNQDLFSNFSRFGFLNSVKYLHEKNSITKKIKRKDNQKIKWNEWSCANASKNGHLHILKYLHEINCPWDKWSCAGAVLNGHLDILKYLHENNCPWNKRICASAAWKGHLECLKYLHENKCPWDEESCENAAENGHLDCLKYLYENNCPYKKDVCLDVAKNNEIKEYIFKYM